MPRADRTAKTKRPFLEALAETANVSLACRLAGVGRRTVYSWRAADPEFAKAWGAALEIGCDALEDEAVRRALSGVEEPVFYQGTRRGTIRKYSDQLLMFLLKARRPEKFKNGPASDGSRSFDAEGARRALDRRLADLAARGRTARVPRKPER
jgi:hypothetical protein